MNTADGAPYSWKGILPVPNTPFSDGNEVDVASLRKLADYTAATGAPAALVLGVASEAAYLSAPEADLVARTFIEQADGRFDVILAISGADAPALGRAAAHARGIRAAAVNYRPTPGVPVAQIIENLRSIAREAPPIIVLQDFDIAGEGMDVDNMLDLLARFPSLKSLKIETRQSARKCQEVAARTGGGVHICSGWPVTGLMDSLDAGVDAYMPTGLTGILMNIYRLYTSGQKERARRTFERLLPLYTFIVRDLATSIRTNKLLRLREGLFATAHCRVPGEPFDEATRAEAERVVAAALEVAGEFPVGQLPTG